MDAAMKLYIYIYIYISISISIYIPQSTMKLVLVTKKNNLLFVENNALQLFILI